MPPLIDHRISWLSRLLYGFVTVLLLVLGFFFLTVALVAGTFVALFVLTRLWWVSRKRRGGKERTELEGEFTVVEQRTSIQQLDSTAADHRP